MNPTQLKYARYGAKLELQRIVTLFPDLLKEVPRVRKIAQAASARAFKTAKRKEN